MGDYPAAASFNEATMKLAISEFGPDTQQTAEALNNLAVTYDHLRRFIEAETLVRRAIEISEKTLGKEHPDVATCYSNLARLLDEQGKYAEAEQLYRRAIEIGEKTLGKEAPRVAIWYANLASLVGEQGKYVEAETLVRRAIDALASSRARICLAMARRASVPLRALRYSSLLGLRTISRFERFDGVPQVFDDRDGWVISH
jgi:tetratricopeptide (TPR) repeat protein